MGYIYKITNKLNNKVYIGQTIRTIEERWKDHQRLLYNEKSNTRPLYLAMAKYGLNNFIIEELEEVKNNKLLDEREKYWINYYNSYNEGYNATYGGNGSTFYDYNLIYELWKEGNTSKSITSLLGCHERTVKRALDSFNVSKDERKIRGYSAFQKKVLMLDKDTEEIINSFNSFAEASRFLGKGNTGGSHIGRACNYNNRTAYGYKWRLFDKPNEVKKLNNNRGVVHKVAMIDKNTNKILQIFKSCADAARKTNSKSATISRVCNNQLITHNGYKWKYID